MIINIISINVISLIVEVAKFLVYLIKVSFTTYVQQR